MATTYKRGYIEGYYGRLFTWLERIAILDRMQELSMDTYFYAPKEDAYHRHQWREPYPEEWRTRFSIFANAAAKRNITVIAGIAPGLDFNFADLGGGGDSTILLEKCRQLLADGADSICLLMDDINPSFSEDSIIHEGTAHASLANFLADHLDAPVTITPRIYADQIRDKEGAYLTHFSAMLNPDMQIFTCGKRIIAHDTALEDTNIVRAGIALDRLIVWDNLYVHDYCPRRLFLGQWLGRYADQSILLNPTGLVETDSLLLKIMAAGEDVQKWQQAFLDEGVPEAFFTIAQFFDLPPRRHDDAPPPAIPDTQKALDDLDVLLWEWKTPLAREWYPFLYNLRHDITLVNNKMNSGRIKRTYPPLLVPHLDTLRRQ